MTAPVQAPEQLIDTTALIPTQPEGSPVSPAVGGPNGQESVQTEFQAPSHSPDLLVTGRQPALPGLEGAAERRARRGHEATAGLGKAALTLVGKVTGLSSSPVRRAGEATRFGFDAAVGAGAEVTETTRARAAGRHQRAAASAHGFSASSAATKEAASANRVAKYARRVVKNEQKHQARLEGAGKHGKASMRAARNLELGAVGHFVSGVVKKTGAGYSNWRVERNAAKLARQERKLDERTGVVETRLRRGQTSEQKGTRRRTEVGLQPLGTVLDQGRLGRSRAERNEHVARRRQEASNVLTARREAAQRDAARRERIAARASRIEAAATEQAGAEVRE